MGKRRYIATSYGANFGSPLLYRVWLVDGDAGGKNYWLREITAADLSHTDAAYLAERLNREMGA